MAKRVFNFNPGPAALPLEVLKQVQEELLDFKGTGMSILEISHRSKEFEEVNNQAMALTREIAGLGNNYKVLFESDKVRDLDVLYKPGDKAAMHMHPYHVAYALTDSKLKFTLPGGKTIDVVAKAGQVMEGPPGLHSPENIGASDAHLILFEVKEPAKKTNK